MIIDESLRNELTESFNDHYDDIENCLNSLKYGDDRETLNSFFRAIHSIKGNAGMCGMEAVVGLSHAMEEVAGALRERRYSANDHICELFLLGMDRLRILQHKELYDDYKGGEPELIDRFTRLSKADSDTAEEMASYFLEEVESNFEIDTECEPSQNSVEVEVEEVEEVEEVVKADVGNCIDKLHGDLAFFQSLALQIDQQSQYWEGRSIQIFEWALKLNKMAGSPVNYEQLSAAIYIHDIGMSFLPSSIINKEGKLSEDEVELLRRHPEWGFGFLDRMPGWEEAAAIVLDHHERFDGKGYPNGKSEDEIHPGAKLIAVIDAFFSITNQRADRDHRKSTIKAISEINSCAGSQFDLFWVQHFNQVLKSEMKDGLV